MKFIIMTLLFGTFTFSSALASVGGKSCGNLEQARVIKSCSTVKNDAERAKCVNKQIKLEENSEASAQRAS